MHEHSYKLSLASTNTPSSDDEEPRFPSKPPPISSKLDSLHRARSLSDAQPDLVNFEEERCIFHTRRASLPLNLDIVYERKLRIPAAKLLEIAYEEKAREGLMSNGMLDDISLLAKSYLDSHPPSEVHSEVIPEENQVREDLDLNPFLVVKDELEDTFLPSPWSCNEVEFEVQEPIEEESEEVQDEFLFPQDGLYKDLDVKVEQPTSPRNTGMIRMTDSIQELEGEDEGEDENTLKHDDFMHKISQNDEKYLSNNEERISSSLHEVMEVDEPQTGGSII